MKRALSLVLCLLLLLPAALPTHAANESIACNTQEWAVLKLVNIERMRRNIAPLTMTVSVQQAAQKRCEELLILVAHKRPNGKDCFTVLDDYRIDAQVAGENVAAGQRDAEQVVNAWMNSSGHRENILNGDFVHMGTGYLPGTLSTEYISYWSQLFVTAECTQRDFRVLNAENLVVPLGTSIEDMNLTAEVTCSVHGLSILPVITKMCIGYNPDQPGTQTVQVSYRGQYTNIKVTVGEIGDEIIRKADGNMGNFTPVLNYYYLYADVSENAWYYDDVYLAEIYDLMRGVSNVRFNQEGTLTVAQALMMAARVRSIYMGGTGKIGQDGERWYTKAYVYCVEQGIINEWEFAGADGKPKVERAATRAEMAYILGKSLPEKELMQIRQVDRIPDIRETDRYGREIYALYRAGVLRGKDGTGRFGAEDAVLRAEAAAILIRLVLPARRDG